MKLDKVSYSIDSKTAMGRITLHFTDTDPSMPQMDNMVHHEISFTLIEWTKLERQVRQIAGIEREIDWTKALQPKGIMEG